MVGRQVTWCGVSIGADSADIFTPHFTNSSHKARVNLKLRRQKKFYHITMYHYSQPRHIIDDLHYKDSSVFDQFWTAPCEETI